MRTIVLPVILLSVLAIYGCDSTDTDADAGSSDDGTAMSFFVSSTVLTGDGNLGGLAGADAHCQALAVAVGAERTSWVAYLSTEGIAGDPAVNAIDRIGSGPWFNADGEVLAANLVDLHPTIDPTVDRDGYLVVKPADALFLTENGDLIIIGHDIFTGSEADGTVYAGRTCQDWTSNSTSDVGRIGHTDTPPVGFDPSWNSAHDTQSCSVAGVRSRGGTGRIYCFATD